MKVLNHRGGFLAWGFNKRTEMIQDLGKRMEAKTEKMREMFTKYLQELKNKQTEMNNTTRRYQ